VLVIGKKRKRENQNKRGMGLVESKCAKMKEREGFPLAGKHQLRIEPEKKKVRKKNPVRR